MSLLYPDATVEPGVLDACSSWSEFESLAVQMSREVPLRTLEAMLADAQERLIDPVCGSCEPIGETSTTAPYRPVITVFAIHANRSMT